MIHLIRINLSSISTINLTIQTSESLDLLFCSMLGKMVIVNGFIYFIFSQNWGFFSKLRKWKRNRNGVSETEKNVWDSVNKVVLSKKINKSYLFSSINFLIVFDRWFDNNQLIR